MYPHFAEVISAERAKEMRDRAAMSGRAKQARRARREARANRRPGAASQAAVSGRWRGLSHRRAAHPVPLDFAAAGCSGHPVR